MPQDPGTNGRAEQLAALAPLTPREMVEAALDSELPPTTRRGLVFLILGVEKPTATIGERAGVSRQAAGRLLLYGGGKRSTNIMTAAAELVSEALGEEMPVARLFPEFK